MGYYADIYVIKKTRSIVEGINFLIQFAPNREESAEDYFIPQYSNNPQYEFDNANDVMKYMEENPTARQSIYWRNLDPDNPNRHATIFYTLDSYMIFGISRNNYGVYNTKNEESCLVEMKRFLKSDEGYITYESPPEENYIEFSKMVKSFLKRSLSDEY